MRAYITDVFVDKQDAFIVITFTPRFAWKHRPNFGAFLRSSVLPVLHVLRR